MSDRITNRQLESLCSVLNKTINGSDGELWTRDNSGGHATIDAFYIDGAYGGVALYRMVTDGGGVSEILGRATKRDLYDQLRALLRGVELAREADTTADVLDNHSVRI